MLFFYCRYQVNPTQSAQQVQNVSTAFAFMVDEEQLPIANMGELGLHCTSTQGSLVPRPFWEGFSPSQNGLGTRLVLREDQQIT